MKKLILYYLYGFLLIDTILRYFYGSIAGGFHSGLIIRGGISILLIHYFIKQNLLPGRMNVFGVSAVLFTAVCILQIVVFNILSSDHVFEGYNSIRFSYKIIFMLLLANFVATNAYFFKPHTDRILYTNIIVFLINCIGGYLFSVGFLSYKALADSYRGYLSGNNSSIMSFVSFGFLLYTIERRPIINLILLSLSAYTFFILGTRAFFAAAFIILIFVISQIRQLKIKTVIICFAICLVLFGILFYSNHVEMVQDRIMKNYNKHLSSRDKNISDFIATPIGVIAPVRSEIAARMLSLQFSDSAWSILFGYGFQGRWDTFGRPSMMDIPMIISFYGIFGFIAIYLGIFKVIFRIMTHCEMDWVSVIIVAIFLYSSFGGFLMGIATTSTLFAFLLGTKYSEIFVDKAGQKTKITRHLAS